jgi:hypothetical protein
VGEANRVNLHKSRGGVAQLVEHLLCTQRVAGSNPVTSTSLKTSFSGHLTFYYKTSFFKFVKVKILNLGRRLNYN